MRYLRMLSDSLLVGAVAAIYLALLFVLLNVTVPLTFGATLPILAMVLLSYGVHIAAATYALFVVRQLVSDEPLVPAWVSLRMLAWTSGISGVVIGTLLWLNAYGYRTAIGEPAMQSLLAGAAFLVAGGALMLALALTRTFVQKAPIVVGTVYTVIALTSVSVPLYLRDATPRPHDAGGAAPARGADTSTSRVFLVLLDGASLDVIAPAVAAGRLPNFGRLLDDGASMHLATTRPTQPEPVWATVATGKWPVQHGIRGAARYRPLVGGPALEILPDLLLAQVLVRVGALREEPHVAADLRALPLWGILDRQGIATVSIGVPLLSPESPEEFTIPIEPALPRDALARLTGDAARDVQADQRHRALFLRVARQPEVRVHTVRYPGLDAVAHSYLRYALPSAFGDVSEEERRRFGRVLDDYYAFVDGLVGEALAAVGPADLLLVVSGFGMEPLTPGKRLLERAAGNAQFSGTHERAPDGFLLAFGASVSHGRLPRGALVDITPTLLYFLDQPVARDMDGFARTDLFSAAFNAQRTITFIPTYDR